MQAADAARCMELWEQWRVEMLEWVHRQLAARGRSVTGPPENRDRPWSLIMKVPTDGGPVWFKANAPAARFEPALTLALGRWAPGSVLTPIAVDTERGWSLLPDGGPRLRDLLDAEPDPQAWQDALVAYAALQRAVAGYVEEMLDLGVPDLRPSRLPEHFDVVLSAPQVRARVGAPDGLTAEQYDALHALRPAFTAWCERLADLGVPPTLDQTDLHDGQVFAAGGRWVFLDWADACVGHPFGTLLVALQRAGERFGSDSPELARLRDAYLEPWTAEHDLADLREAAALATRLGTIGRALAWHRIFPATEPLVWDMHGRDVARFLSRLLETQEVVSP